MSSLPTLSALVDDLWNQCDTIVFINKSIVLARKTYSICVFKSLASLSFGFKYMQVAEDEDNVMFPALQH